MLALRGQGFHSTFILGLNEDNLLPLGESDEDERTRSSHADLSQGVERTERKSERKISHASYWRKRMNPLEEDPSSRGWIYSI